MANSTIDLSILGYLIRVRSRNTRFIQYCGSFLDRFIVPDASESADLDVRFVGEHGEKNEHDSSATIYGSDFWRTENSYHFHAHPPSGIYCSIEGMPDDSQSVVCQIKQGTLRKLTTLLPDRERRKRQLWMSVIRQAVLLPILARALVARNILTVHASTVSLDGKGVLLTGLNGCGKSSLAARLVLERGFQYLSDNYGLADLDGNLLLPFPEPLRLSTSKTAKSSELFIASTSAFGKTQFQPRQRAIGSPSQIAFTAMLSLSDVFSVIPLEPAAFVDEIDGLHRFLRETPEYSWVHLYYLQAFGLDLGSVARKHLHILSELAPAFRIAIPMSADEIDLRADDWICAQLNAEQ